MDVTISCKLIRQLSAAAFIAFAGLPAARAESSGSTAVFVTDSVPPTKSEAQHAARGALTFVEPTRVEPVAKPTRMVTTPAAHSIHVIKATKQPIARSVPQQVAELEKQSLPRPTLGGPSHRELTAASNQQRKQALQASAPLKRQTNPRPDPFKNAQQAAHTVPASQVQPIQKASLTADQRTKKLRVEPSPPPVDPITKLLIDAHELSLQAASEVDYSAIVELCSDALRLGAVGDKKSFARQLTSWSLNRRGQLRLDAGEKIIANADFQTAIDFSSENWRALHNRGVSHAQSGELAEAFDDFNSVLEINPQYAKAYANRATLYVQANDLQAALEDYQRAGALDPNLAAAHAGQGRVCHVFRRLEEAVEHFSTAVQVDPTNADIVCSRGDLQADMGRYANALSDYARTIELDPEFGHAYRNGAWLLATCPNASFRDPDNALLGARQALDIGYGEQHVALDTLAAALASAGEFEEAVDTIAQAIDLAPDNAKFAYLSRMQMYQERQPFRTEPVGDVAQAVYKATDK
jgi:tetratricopeptide (TPR) repeat protein